MDPKTGVIFNDEMGKIGFLFFSDMIDEYAR